MRAGRDRVRGARAGFAALAIAIAVAVALAGCSHSASDRGAAGPRATTAPSEILVAIGADATHGTGLAAQLRDSWPQLLYREDVPVSTVFVNASDERATVGSARSSQLRLALEQHATVVVIWLDAADTPCSATTTASAYVPDLDALVQPLRASHARVLIGNVSRAQRCGAAFDDALDQVARSRGATVVDLASALAATPTIGPRSSVTPSISRAIANAFAAASPS